MKKNFLRKIFSVMTVTCFAFFLYSFEVKAQNSGETTPVQSQQFKLIILGSRSYTDINTIRKKIESNKLVKQLLPAVSVQKHVQFEGQYFGDPESLAQEIEEAVTDKFDVRSKKDKNDGFVITLRSKSY